MKAAEDTKEVFLQPGELYFGDSETRIRTILGSCVALTLWHPQRRIGGMCHYMLPKRSRQASGDLDGRYATEAMDLLLQNIRDAGTRPGEYELKLFGGGNMFPAVLSARGLGGGHIGGSNIEMARHLARSHGLPIIAEHLGGVGHRHIIFEVDSGTVWVRHEPGGNK